MTTKRRMTCSVCGEDAGRHAQHWNRDTGFGICVRCVGWLRDKGYSEQELERLYGREGEHWGAEERGTP